MDGIVELIKDAGSVWDWVKRAFATIGVFGMLVVGIAIGRGCSEKDPVVHVEVRKDSTDAVLAEKAIAEKVQTAEENKTLKAKLEKTLGIVQTLQASGTVGGKPNEKLVMVEVPVAGDTVNHYYAAPYDFPIAGRIEGGNIEFVTANLLSETRGEPSRKHYIFPFLRGDMYFIVAPNPDPEQLNGIQVAYHKRFAYYDGTFIGAGYDLTQKWNLSLASRVVFYENYELSLRLKSTPSVELRVEYRW